MGGTWIEWYMEDPQGAMICLGCMIGFLIIVGIAHLINKRRRSRKWRTW